MTCLTSSNIEAVVRQIPSPEWDYFVRLHGTDHQYQLSGWTQLARTAFGLDVYFVEARDPKGELCGVLPLVLQKGVVLSRFMTSIPFFNYGGALATTEAASLQLMECARDLASSLGCSYLELRDSEPYPGNWKVRTDKVSMILQLPPDAATLSKQLGGKLRSQIRRPDREAPAVRTGGRELLSDFYSVFSQTMRDLGTPVYPKRFFEAVLRSFPNECLVVVVYRKGAPAAAGFLILTGNRAEIPWAACRSDAKSAGFNMRLYWEVLTAAIDRGFRQFDFGRSTIDSGTYKFKQQWGAEPRQLFWHRWEKRSNDSGEASSPRDGKLLEYAASVWKRLPLRVANVLGPLISPRLPW